MVKDVNSKNAFQEAADVLRQASKIATKRDDIDSLLNVTAAWIQIGVHLSDIEDDEDDDKPTKLGFNIGIEDGDA